MSDLRIATVRWLSPAEGGREAPPTGKEYITVARFSHPAGDWTENAWSVVLHFGESPTEAEVHFLVAEAPEDLLRPGAVFELFEGRRKVAVATVRE